MKLKKYICYTLILILTLSVGMNNVKADTVAGVNAAKKVKIKEGTPFTECYYLSPEGAQKKLKVAVRLFWGDFATTSKDVKYGSTVSVNNFAGKLSTKSNYIENWSSDYTTGSCNGVGCGNPPRHRTESGINFESSFYSFEELRTMTTGTCPKYIVVEYDKGEGLTFVGDWLNDAEYFSYATNSISLATQAANSKKKGYSYAYASNFNESGQQITQEMYMSTFVIVGGDKIDATELDCKEDILTPEIKEMINDVLQYVRILVPILIIILGTIDLAKAAIASKEDEMKKAQKDFIKRIIMGVAVFFVPLLVDVIIELANIVWEKYGYITCNFQ